ncbi:DUF3800 domain-containing protein [Providencia manganoxydans]|uniref:DUF3800 domain-containing protein n=1 Tax=Providencia manganoxydans TaxID=2923283 RepID=UPI0034E50D4A
MYFYVDESGQTGLELFDEKQPFLYYGVLSSKLNLDVLALDLVKELRKKLDTKRLHAKDLGSNKLTLIIDDILKLQKKYDIRFDFYCVAKSDYAIMAFFDQVFDQGLNPAITWSAYWTPLRYVLLTKLAYLFDEDLAKEAWKARIEYKDDIAEAHLINVCNSLLERVNWLSDERSRTLISDALYWVINNPSRISYNAKSKDNKLQISPNLIGFQSVMHGIAHRLKKNKCDASKIIVDRQTEFNKAQQWLAKFYSDGKKINPVFELGPFLPSMDLSNMPSVPIECTPGTESVGLELVDIYTWIFKRAFERKDLSPALYKLIKKQSTRGLYNEISIHALANRWQQWFKGLPQLSEFSAQDLAKGKELLKLEEERRKVYVVKR